MFPYEGHREGLMHMSSQTGMLPFRNESVFATCPHRNDCSEESTVWCLGNIRLARIDCFAS